MHPTHSDSSFPVEMVVIPMFIGSLVWLCTMLNYFPLR